MLLQFVLAVSTPASAAEVQFDGFYRARGRAFDTLTLDRDHPQNEGWALYAEHRLWLAPRFLLSDEVGAYVEIRGLDGVVWGDQQASPVEFAGLSPTMPEHDLTAPTSPTDETTPLLDFTLWRAYGRVDTPIGHFTFGRVPLHWGSGIWLNDGIQVDPVAADHGDTTDRVQWEMLVQDEFYVSVAVDVPVEAFIGATDDTTAFSFAVAYRTESLSAGILTRLDHAGRRLDDGVVIDSLNVFTADGTVHAVAGKLELEAELLGQFGGGDFDGGLNDTNILAFGATLHANLDVDEWRVALRTGLATGDGNNTDVNLKSFTFDRDYSVGMFLFEQPMPVLSTSAAAANESNGGRDFDAAVTSNALSNALFLKPTITRHILPGLHVDVSWLNARVARTLKIEGYDQLRSYGNEFQLGVRYDGIEHLEVGARWGTFFPGSVYSVDPENLTLETGFEEPAFGGELSARIVF